MVPEQWDPHMQKKKKNLDTDLTPFTKINLNCVTDLNIKHENYKTSRK